MISEVNAPIGNYQAADGVHEVLVDLDATGAWRVLDKSTDQTLVIERLDGVDDDDEQAVATAVSYLRQLEAFFNGDRDAMPCPHPAGAAAVLQARPTGSTSLRPLLRAA